MKSIIIAITLAACLSASFAHDCPNPAPSVNFTSKGYNGAWYEVAKKQTWLGGFFESGCQCTVLNNTFNPVGSTFSSSLSCRKNSPKASPTVVETTLIPKHDENPGAFDQKIWFSTIDYRVIYLDEESSIEFDCRKVLGLITNYCIHILSRTPTLSQEKINFLVQYAESLGLNPENLDLHITAQDGCWQNSDPSSRNAKVTC